ncbi:hypothetical protein [Hugenholtzia roseola]|uniref:hypothetical protein n=1 Tax=Hugenholtzia roseola TaxID=1002 RepID=UPI00047C9F3B|nr:hypothetical protein [Hugenholtzia roseola]
MINVFTYSTKQKQGAKFLILLLFFVLSLATVLAFVYQVKEILFAVFFFALTILIDKLVILFFRLEIRKDSLVFHSFLHKVVFKKEQIQGFRLVTGRQPHIKFYRKAKFFQIGTFVIEGRIENYTELCEWARLNLTNLDSQELLADVLDIEKNSHYGITLKVRKGKLRFYRILINLLTLATVAGLPALFYFSTLDLKNEKLYYFLSFLIPLFSFFLYLTGSGLVKISGYANSVRPIMVQNLLLPALILQFYNFLKYQNYFLIKSENHAIAALFLTLFFLAFLLLFEKVRQLLKEDSPAWSLVFLTFSVFLLFYNFIYINIFTQKNKESYRQDFVIVGKNINEKGSSKSPIYQISLKCEEKLYEKNNMSVSKAFFDRYKKGDKLPIVLYKGGFGFEYYILYYD